MTTSLEAKNVIGFIDGSIPKPEETDAYYNIWCRCNSMVKSWLLNSVTKKIYTIILYFQSAADIWKDLHTGFHKSNLPRLYKLRHQLQSLRQGNMDLSSYHTQTQAYWEELSSLQVTARTVEALLAEKETNRVIDFLMGLNDSYDHIRSQIIMKKTLPSLSEVYNILDQDDSQRSARIQPHSGIAPSAFQASSGPPNGNAMTHRPRPVCSHCGGLGHVVDRCYKRHGYPPGLKSKGKFQYPKKNFPSPVSTNMIINNESHDITQNQLQHSISGGNLIQNQFQNSVSSGFSPGSGSTSPPAALTPDQIQQFIAYFSTQLNNHSTPPTQEGLPASTSAVPSVSKVSDIFPSLYNFPFVGMSSVLFSGDALVSADSWVIDSGATHHVSHSQSLFSHLSPLTDTFVTLPSGISESIVGIGSITLSEKIV